MIDKSINVLVIRTPRVIEDIEACMAHIRQGLREGVLILGADVKYNVEQFPPLGYAAVEDAHGKVVFDLRRGEITEPEDEPEAEAAEEPPRGGGAENGVPADETAGMPSEPVRTGEKLPPPAGARGSRSAEKRDIFERLVRYREAHGAEWAKNIANASGGRVSGETLRSIMYNRAAVPIGVWREIGKALNKMEDKKE